MDKTFVIDVKTIFIGAASLVLAAALGGAVELSFHWYANDVQIHANVERLSKLEAEQNKIDIDLTRFHEEHAYLIENEAKDHKEEMEAIMRVEDKADKAAIAAAQAAAHYYKGTSMNVDDPPAKLNTATLGK